MDERFRGIFGIVVTPFCDDLSLDLESLRSEMKFCIASGGHGVVAGANASEFSSLSDEERCLLIEKTVEYMDGRLPVVAGVSGVSTPVAVKFAHFAKAAGADAIMALPPYVHKASEAEIFDYYCNIAKAVPDIPLFIQHFKPPIGTYMRPDFLVKLVREIDSVKFIKEESEYAGHVITKIMELTKGLDNDTWWGVMGGKGGRYVFDEYKRGACGNMPACQVMDVHAQVWNALEDGNESRAREIFNAALPLFTFEAQFGNALYKEVLFRRGIIRTNRMRQPGGRYFDRYDANEVDYVLEHLKPYFAV